MTPFILYHGWISGVIHPVNWAGPRRSSGAILSIHSRRSVCLHRTTEETALCFFVSSPFSKVTGRPVNRQHHFLLSDIGIVHLYNFETSLSTTYIRDKFVDHASFETATWFVRGEKKKLSRLNDDVITESRCSTCHIVLICGYKHIIKKSRRQLDVVFHPFSSPLDRQIFQPPFLVLLTSSGAS